MSHYYQQDDEGAENGIPSSTISIDGPRIIDEEDMEELLRNHPAVNEKTAWELHEQRETAPCVSEMVQKRLYDEREKIDGYRAQLNLIEHRVDHFGYDLSDAAIEKKRITRLIEKATERAARINTRAHPGGFTLEQLLPVLRSNKRLVAERVSKTFKGSDEAQRFIDARRVEVVNFNKRRDEIEAAPLTLDEARAALVAYVDRLAQQGRPGLLGLAYTSEGFDGAKHQGQVSFATEYLDLPEGGTVEVFNALAFMAWRDSKAMKQILIDELKRVFDGKGSISLVARRALLSEIKNKALNAERLEEAAICWLRDNGYEYSRRYDADPLAVAQVRYRAASDIDEDFDFG